LGYYKKFCIEKKILLFNLFLWVQNNSRLEDLMRASMIIVILAVLAIVALGLVAEIGDDPQEECGISEPC